MDSASTLPMGRSSRQSRRTVPTPLGESVRAQRSERTDDLAADNVVEGGAEAVSQPLGRRLQGSVHDRDREDGIRYGQPPG
jgi:hypothetical protein